MNSPIWLAMLNHPTITLTSSSGNCTMGRSKQERGRRPKPSRGLWSLRGEIELIPSSMPIYRALRMPCKSRERPNINKDPLKNLKFSPLARESCETPGENRLFEALSSSILG